MQAQPNTRVYHGNISAVDIARALKAEFHRGNFVVETFGKPEKIVLQITTKKISNQAGKPPLQ